MSIDWIWSCKDSAGVQPAIGDQLVSVDNNHLRIRNPWVADCALMGKMHSSAFFCGLAIAICIFVDDYNDGVRFDYALLVASIVLLAWVCLMLMLRVRMIKNISDVVFDRDSGRVSCIEYGRVISGDWGSVAGGHQSEWEFTGRSVILLHSLMLRMRAESVKPGGVESKPVSLFVSIESNEPTEPFVLYLAQVWEFIRIFMDEGPGKLPDPGESSWWNSPNVRIYLTPAQALRHYVPWRTGEPNEMQGKSNWLLPLWLVFFPYNMFCALCWYAVCRMFKVQGMPPPVPGMRRDEPPASRQR